MNREALIEAMAFAIHAWETEGEQMDGRCEHCWETVEDLGLAPAVVDFFAEWLIQKSKENSRQYPWRLYEQWREEMGP